MCELRLTPMDWELIGTGRLPPPGAARTFYQWVVHGVDPEFFYGPLPPGGTARPPDRRYGRASDPVIALVTAGVEMDVLGIAYSEFTKALMPSARVAATRFRPSPFLSNYFPAQK
jgi:hypothetical protein